MALPQMLAVKAWVAIQALLLWGRFRGMLEAPLPAPPTPRRSPSIQDVCFRRSMPP